MKFRKIIAVLSAAMLALCVTGCGDDETETSSSKTKNSSAESSSVGENSANEEEPEEENEDTEDEETSEYEDGNEYNMFNNGIARIDNCYFNKNGELIFKADDYYYCGYFSNGLAFVGKEAEYTDESQREYDREYDNTHRYGYIDTNGKMVIDYIYTDAHDFSEGIARVRTTDYNIGFINTKGEWVIEPIYKEVKGDCQNGLICARDEATGKFGYLNKKGEWAIKPQYKDAGGFYDNVALVANEGHDKWSFIDSTGAVLFDWDGDTSDYYFAFDDFDDRLTRYFCDGLSLVRKKNTDEYGKYGYVNKKGELAIDFKFSGAYDFFDGYAIAQDVATEKVGLIDTNGEWVVEPRFDGANYSYKLPHDKGMYTYLTNKYNIRYDDEGESCDYEYYYVDKDGQVTSEFYSADGYTIDYDEDYNIIGIADRDGNIIKIDYPNENDQ